VIGVPVALTAIAKEVSALVEVEVVVVVELVAQLL